jgi:RimJ/RimL family protein N-acetyltransferase
MNAHPHASNLPPPAEAESRPLETLPDGSRVMVRPIDRNDRELERRFIKELSVESRHFRFQESMSEPSEDLLSLLTATDQSRAALGAVDPHTGRLVGVARFSENPDGTAEFAVAVSDDWQRRGVGSLLLRKLVVIARKRGILRMYSSDSCENHSMRALAQRLGFAHHSDPDDPTVVIYTTDLSPLV